MTFRIALNFEDGATHFIECNLGETVLDAAFRHKVNLPMDCSDGVCGTCKCKCQQGNYDLGDEYIEEALSEDEAGERLVLTCQMLPSTDCVIEVPVPSSACKLKPAAHGGEVSAIELVSESSIVLRLKLDNPAALKFLPGQYAHLEIPGTGEQRAYSFSSKPGADETEFLIRNIPGGRMSQWLTAEAKPGDRVSLTGPNGSFFLRAVERPLLMLAGGTGLAPFLSMLEQLADDGCERPIHLIYGVTRDEDLVETGRLEALAARFPSLDWMACVADADSNHPLKGYVTQHLTDAQLNGGDCDLYLCGPPPMVEAVRLYLRDENIDMASFHYEKFAPSEAVAA